MRTLGLEKDCSTCKKSDVCKYQDEFKKIKRKAKSIEEDKQYGSPFSVYVECKSYEEDKNKTKDFPRSFEAQWVG